MLFRSTIAWGFYALGVVHFVHGWVYRIIDSFDYNLGLKIVWVILALVLVDYVIQLLKVFHVNVREKFEQLRRLVLK